MATSKNLNKSMMPDESAMVQNLLAYYALAQRDQARFQYNFNWYVWANRECQMLADTYGLSLHKVCQIVSAISPGKRWEINISDAVTVIDACLASPNQDDRIQYLRDRHFTVGYTWDNPKKSFLAFDGWDIPQSSDKTYDFGMCLEFPNKDCQSPMDLHMIHITTGTRLRGSINPGAHYGRLAKTVTFTAHLLNILPSQLNGATWGFRVDQFAAGMSVDTLCELVDSIMGEI